MTASSLQLRDRIEIQSDQVKMVFEALRDELIDVFSDLEDNSSNTLYTKAPGHFIQTPWSRGEGKKDLGGGVMSIMRGRLFEKVGVHCSTVYGTLPPDLAKRFHGTEEDPNFFATGLSLIAHMQNPHIPAAHLNARYIATTKTWFGGVIDLNPTQAYQRDKKYQDSQDFHNAAKLACDAHDPHCYDEFSQHCDRYFWLPHRQEPRGTGGIFFDHLSSGDHDRDLNFVKGMCRAFIDIYPKIVRRRMNTQWTQEERREQCIQRGRYAEFNLLYDRGIKFGLQTNGNVESMMSSMPPEAIWP